MLITRNPFVDHQRLHEHRSRVESLEQISTSLYTPLRNLLRPPPRLPLILTPLRHRHEDHRHERRRQHHPIRSDRTLQKDLRPQDTAHTEHARGQPAPRLPTVLRLAAPDS